MGRRLVRTGILIGIGAALLAAPLAAQGSHAWGSYHWARTSNPLAITVVDSVSSDWDDNLQVAVADWAQSKVLAPTIATGDDSLKTRKRCAASSGVVRVCNAPYGNNGWLGLAQIWVSGGHITQAVAKMNDSYLATSRYSETNRQHVMCQEVGHDWGLGHQDESGADLNTCMDYSRALDNPHPNAHDYEQLEAIYSHLESAAPAARMPKGFANADVHAQAAWGTKVQESANGRSAIFVRSFGDGNLVVTHVTWAR